MVSRSRIHANLICEDDWLFYMRKITVVESSQVRIILEYLNSVLKFRIVRSRGQIHRDNS